MKLQLVGTVMTLGLLGLGTAASAQTAGDANVGKDVYNRLCQTCHGASGKGDGPAAAGLNPKPKNLVEAKAKGDEHLKKVIMQGGAAAGLSPTMPPWSAALKPGELEGLIAFIKTLQ